MKFFETNLQGVTLIEHQVFADNRGSFFESFNSAKFKDILANGEEFVQDNQSISKKHVLRGLHYQIQQAQGKLVRVVKGSIFDVAVDLRKDSKTFGQWYGTELTDSNNKMLFIPKGCAHGFLSLEDDTVVLYKTTDFWAPQHERTLIWNDKDLQIKWPLDQLTPILSAKDSIGNSFNQSELY